MLVEPCRTSKTRRLERDNRLSSLSDINHTAWSDYCLLDQWSARECLQAKAALSAIIFNSKGQKYCAAYSCSCPRSRLTSEKSQKSDPFRRRGDAIHRVVTARASGTFEKNPNLGASGSLRCSNTEPPSATNCCHRCHPSFLSEVASLLSSDSDTCL